MFIKQFRSTWVRVPDPMRPGRRALEERLVPTGTTALSHPSGEYEADRDGWIEVPHDVGVQLCAFASRDPHGGAVTRFYTPAEVNEQVRLGALDESNADAPAPKARRTRNAD